MTTRFCINIILIVLINITSGFVSAQDAPLYQDAKFRSLSTREGLSQDTILDLQFDDNGFLYLATENGLNRWDGYHIKNIVGQDQQLRDTTITSLYYNDPYLFVGTASRGAFIFNTQSGFIEHNIARSYVDYPDLQQYVNGFSLDNQGRLNIVFDTQIVNYDVQQNTEQTVYSLTPEQFDDGHFLRWSQRYDDQLFVGSSRQLIVVNQQGEARPVNFLPDDIVHDDSQNIKHLSLDSKGCLWIATFRGVYILEPNAIAEAVATGNVSNTTVILPDRDVWRVTEDANQNYWIATGQGLYRARHNAEGFDTDYLFEPKRGYEALSLKDIYDVVVDFQGNLWMGTGSSGALYWSPMSESFTTLQNTTLQSESEHKLSHNGVWSIAEGDNGKLWIGTENGLNYWDSQSHTSQIWHKGDEVRRYSQYFIDRIHTLFDGSLILTTGEGFFRFSPDNGQITRLPSKDPDEQVILNDYVYGAAIDDDNRLWFSSESRFYHYHLDTQHLVEVPTSGQFNALFFGGFLGTEPRYNNQMFVSAAASLWLLDMQSFELTKIHSIDSDAASLEVYPSGYTLDDQNTLWIAYAGYGLYGLDADTFAQKYHFNRSTPLGTDMIYSVLLDDMDNLWVSSQQGLHRVAENRNDVHHFRYGEPLALSEFNQGASAKMADGSLAFGSPSGLVLFDPENIDERLKKRASIGGAEIGMNITEFSVATQPDRLSLSNYNNLKFILAHNDTGIQVRYSNMKFGRDSNQWYHYQLLKDGEIISEQDTQQAIVTFPFLEPGNYQFSVYERGVLGKKGTRSASIQLIVDHAPWASPQAYLAYAIILLFSGTALLRQRRKQRSILYAEKLKSSIFGKAFQQTRDCVVLLDSDYTPYASNQAFNTIFGVTSEAERSSQWCKLLDQHPDLHSSISKLIHNLKDSALATDEFTLAFSHDNVHEFQIKASLVEDSELNDDSLYLLIFSDISEQKSTERMLTQMATHDTLTGLANRQLLMDRLEHAIHHAKEHQRELAVMFIDLDRFKTINDSLGHDMGDALLVEVSQRMRTYCPQDMTLARVGGDEFVAIAEDIHSIDAVTDLAKTLINIVERPVLAGGETLRVSCSVGAAIYPLDASSPDELLRFADMAMYSAKKDAVTPFCFYTRAMNEAAHEKLQIENLVKKAAAESLFFNVYQPIVNAVEGKTVGFELLLRCRVDGQFLPPNEFIPVLEQLRMIIDVTKAAVESAIRELSRWYKQGFNGYMSVNLSALHFADDIDVDFFVQCLERNDLPIQALRFEVTENVLMNDKNQALKQFNRLSMAGFKLALDDFGTGYSSLGYLSAFPLNVLKIDKSFCDDIGVSKRGSGLVTATIGLSHSLSMGCIAEGVENLEQVLFLCDAGCPVQQGYHFSRPVIAEEAADLATRQWPKNLVEAD